MVFCLENNEPRRRLRSTMVHFQASEVQQLLHNKFVVILGDSIQRAVYKDLVLLLQKDSLLTAAQLKAKGELSFEQDQLVAGGQLGELHNGTQYREVRQFCSGSGHHLVRFYSLFLSPPHFLCFHPCPRSPLFSQASPSHPMNSSIIIQQKTSRCHPI